MMLISTIQYKDIMVICFVDMAPKCMPACANGGTCIEGHCYALEYTV